MASSNVEYYQKQKELQDFLSEQEQRRKHLEQQLQVYCRSDERLAKLRATRLQSYWRKICEDQRRSQQRNDQILREFERIDTHLHSLSARTERLRLLKQQYEDYIERTYPQWHQQVLQRKHRRDEETHQSQGRPSNIPPGSQYTPQNQAMVSDQFVASTASSQFVSQPVPTTPQSSMIYASPSQNQYVTSTPANRHQQAPSVSVTPIHRDTRDGQVTQESAVYANFTSVSRNNTAPQQQISQNQHQIEEELITPRRQPPRSEQQGYSSQGAGYGYKVPAEKESDAQLKVSDLQGDISISSDMPSEQPMGVIQSVTVEKSGQIVHQVPRGESPDVKSNSGQMEPDSADDEISNFDDDDELPLSGRQAPTPAHQAARKTVPDEFSSSEESAIPTPQPGGPPVLKVPTAGVSASPYFDLELTVDGVIHLVKYVENCIPDALSLEGLYRSTRPQVEERAEIISKGNEGVTLSDLDAEMVTMVILEQLSYVIRSLPAGCLLPDAILASSHSITEVQIGRVLSMEAKPLWDCLFNHFMQLVKNKVMTCKEVSAIFVPCLISEESDYHAKAYELLVNLLEKKSEQMFAQPTPRESAESIKSSLGGVPPLKFGSLVDSKAISDDEDTTMVTPSVPTDAPKVPLNETAAYRNLLSGTMSGQKAPSHHDNDEDDTDDDVEKQFASTLSPRTPRDNSSSVIPPPTTAITPSQSRPSQQMEPLSETSSATSPVYVPTGMDKSGKSDGGSTGRSAQMTPFKRPPAAVMISSDLDSETDLDILEKKQTSHEDDDFFDFYE